MIRLKGRARFPQGAIAASVNCSLPGAGVAALAAFGLFAPLPVSAQTMENPAPLRLCADPDNLPFSSDSAAKPGLYQEIGARLAKALGRPVENIWYRTNFGNRSVRVTMLANQCDATIGLPKDSDFMGPRVIFSRPLFNTGYAMVTAPDVNAASLNALKGKRVAVQFATTPHNMLGPRDDITTVTIMSPEEGMKALADGKVDAAFIWGPTAGYLNQTRYGSKYTIQSVDGPALSWPTAIGFAKTNTALRDQIDAILTGLAPEVTDLLKKYGFPSGPSITLSAAEQPRPIRLAAAINADAFALFAAAQAQQNDFGLKAKIIKIEANDSKIEAGKEIFNGTCSHCHGPDAVQGEKKIDLRRLTTRYEGEAEEVYFKTVTNGRPAKGMPAWKEVFTPEQLADVYAYLMTRQTKE